MNILKEKSLVETLSLLFQTLSPSARLEIVLAIGEAETCVCHLEAMLGYRQAYISQHLMALRNADLIESRREGRYIYHRLKDPALLELIHEAAQLSGFEITTAATVATDCCCPKCVV